jgi:pimeloyl-ACP methyl ester carboxylesterase
MYMHAIVGELTKPWAGGLRHVAVNGCELRYLRLGEGQTLVLIHTLRTQLDYFFPLVSELVPGFDVVAVDLPGHGHSTAPLVDYSAAYFTDTTERFLDACGLKQVILVGESIGASIALGLAARQNPRVARVVALNPYDYGRWGGIRRSSTLAKILFTAMLWPGIGSIVARSGTKSILRRVMQGGLHNPKNLSPELVEELYQSGWRPGHPRAFRSLCLSWRSWIAARPGYESIRVPVVLVYAERDWSLPAERDANAKTISGARRVSLPESGHFSCLEQPRAVAKIIRESGR